MTVHEYKIEKKYFIHVSRFLVACYATLHPALSVRLSVGRSVGHTFTFFMNFIFWPHCSCPNATLPSNMAPAHPHATGVAVYPALLKCDLRLDSLKE